MPFETRTPFDNWGRACIECRSSLEQCSIYGRGAPMTPTIEAVGPRQAVRQDHGPRRSGPGGRAGAGPGHPGAQRGRQDHVRPRGGHAAPARRGHAAGRGPRRPARAGGGSPDDRPGRPVRRRRAGHDRAGEPGDGRAAVRPERPRGAVPHRRGPRAAGADRGRRPPGAHLLGRHAAQARPRRQPGRGAAAAAAGRADDRARPPGAHRPVGRDPGAGGRRGPTSC